MKYMKIILTIINRTSYNHSYMSYRNFVDSIKSPKTLNMYDNAMKRYIEHYLIIDADELLKPDRKQIQEMLKHYIIHRQRVEKVSSQTVNIDMSAIKHFYTFNDYTEINWPIVRQYLGEKIKTVKDRAYNVEEIRAIYHVATMRMRMAILVLVSTGMRIGAFVDVKMEDLHPINNIYKFSVYPGTKDEYFTYCTPEARNMVDEYIKMRMSAGENVTPKSYLIREEFDRNKKNKVENPRRITTPAMTQAFKTLAEMAALREVNKTGTRRLTTAMTRKRKEVMLIHGLRKFFYRALNRQDIKPEVREFLMGHKTGNLNMGVSNLMMIYEATEDNEALWGYMKAIPSLTIYKEDVLNAELQETRTKLAASMSDRESIMQEIMDRMDKKYADLLKASRGESALPSSDSKEQI